METTGTHAVHSFTAIRCSSCIFRAGRTFGALLSSKLESCDRVKGTVPLPYECRARSGRPYVRRVQAGNRSSIVCRPGPLLWSTERLCYPIMQLQKLCVTCMFWFLKPEECVASICVITSVRQPIEKQ